MRQHDAGSGNSAATCGKTGLMCGVVRPLCGCVRPLCGCVKPQCSRLHPASEVLPVSSRSPVSLDCPALSNNSSSYLPHTQSSGIKPFYSLLGIPSKSSAMSYAAKCAHTSKSSLHHSKCSLHTPSYVKCSHHTPSSVKCSHHTPSSVKCSHHTPSSVKCSHHTPSSVKPSNVYSQSPPKCQSRSDGYFSLSRNFQREVFDKKKFAHKLRKWDFSFGLLSPETDTSKHCHEQFLQLAPPTGTPRQTDESSVSMIPPLSFLPHTLPHSLPSLPLTLLPLLLLLSTGGSALSTGEPNKA